jgi:hypothetical protein
MAYSMTLNLSYLWSRQVTTYRIKAAIDKRELAIFWYKNQSCKPTNEKVAVEFILH